MLLVKAGSNILANRVFPRKEKGEIERLREEIKSLRKELTSIKEKRDRVLILLPSTTKEEENGTCLFPSCKGMEVTPLLLQGCESRSPRRKSG